MPGSSRSLQRALSSVFENWDSASDWKTDPSPQVRALYGTIYAYTERHNTLTAISSTVDDELRATHDEHIKNSGDVSREVFFLELLSRLSGVLGAHAVELWLRTYLRPAVDSAGFDLSFVFQAHKFINSLTLEVFPTDDAALLSCRKDIASMVMEHILRIFIGGEPEAYAMIGMQVSEFEQSTQIHAERVRFIERNASLLLKEWGLQNPQPFFTLLHKFYQSPKKRFKVLDLAAKAVSSNVSQIQKILDTPFFLDLLRSLILDRSETILGSCLSILLMTIGKVCHKISAYLPEILAIYTRLSLWKEFGPQLSVGHIPNMEVSWAFAESDQNTSIMQTQIYADGEFNLSYFATLVYGLFPLNLLAYCKSPHEYMQRNPPKMIFPETSSIRDTLAKHEDVKNALVSRSKTTLSGLMLHPNILQNLTLQDELKNPIRWILTKNDGDIGEEEVLIECFGMNPDILFSVPDTIVLPERLLQKIQSTKSLTNDASDLRFLHPFPTAFPSDDSYPTSQRGSFQSSSEYTGMPNLDSKLPSHWLNIDRRVSIVPTRLVLENHSAQAPGAHSPPESEVRFKSFDFGGSSIHSDSTVREEKPEKRKDHLAELYTVHEKLFTSSTAVSNQTTLNTDTAHSTKGHFQGSASTASDILSKQLRTEGKAEIQCEPKDAHQFAGSALDFYQRELLLMKNELEFSSYMKHLNKINYIKLKLKFNRMVKESAVLGASKKEDQMVSVHEYDALVETMKNLRSSSDRAVAAKTAENKQLFEKLASLQHETEQISADNEKRKTTLMEHMSMVEKMKDEFTKKEEKVRDLQHQIGLYEEKKLASPVKSVLSDKEPEPPLLLTEAEKTTANLEAQLGIAKAENENLAISLQKATSELESLQKNVGVRMASTTSELEDAFRERTASYEKKIRELNGLRAKYEQVLEEQGARIAQLSKAKPIRIPGMGSQTGQSTSSFGTRPYLSKAFPGDSGEYFPGNQKSEGPESSPHRRSPVPSSGSVSSSATAPGQPDTYQRKDPPRIHSSSTIPIIKGRGGYQKRSKKIM